LTARKTTTTFDGECVGSRIQYVFHFSLFISLREILMTTPTNGVPAKKTARQYLHFAVLFLLVFIGFLWIKSFLHGTGSNRLIGDWHSHTCLRGSKVTFRAHSFHGEGGFSLEKPVTADIGGYEVRGDVIAVTWNLEGYGPLTEKYTFTDDNNMRDQYGCDYHRD
jgi:hypothetical protein